MADIEELLTDAPVRLAPAAAVRARGERRRARQRTAVAAVAVVAAGSLGFGVWAGLVLPQEKGADRTEVAAPGPNPFLSDGVVETPDPSELPGHEVLRWRTVHTETDDEAENAPLPQAGLDAACEVRAGGAAEPEQQFTQRYVGKDGARARYRVSEYATPAAAAEAVSRLDSTLVNCGVDRAEGAKGTADAEYSGVTRQTAAQLVVTVKSWGAWVAVQETQLLPADVND
ncbi:hypothetical protein [Streptomyces sp. NPDC059452]|uniref:hypothetical protein n=1 Tax=Streptomyces sp. NPDC059452 TaxID=3346835 RepID=UPI0036C00F61